MTMAAIGQASSPPGPTGQDLAVAAFSLGWQIAVLHYQPKPRQKTSAGDDAAADLPDLSDLTPWEEAQNGLAQLGTLLAVVIPTAPPGIDPDSVTEKGSQAALEGSDAASWKKALLELHLSVVRALSAGDVGTFRAYDLGRALRQTCAVPPKQTGQDDQVWQAKIQGNFGRYRVATIQDRLADLAGRLPDHAAGGVSASLAAWAEWINNGPGAIGDRCSQARFRLTRQGQLWRAVLAGEKDATKMLDAQNYLTAGVRLTAKLARLTRRFLFHFWWQTLLLLAATGGVVYATFWTTSTQSVVGSLGALAAALGVTRKGIVANGEKVIADLLPDLWEAELDLAAGEAITKLPPPALTTGVARLRRLYPPARRTTIRVRAALAAGPDPVRAPD
jgi:hypothetical protein